MLDTLKGLIASKKAVAMIVGVLMGAFGKKLGLDEDSLTKIIGSIMAYVIGQGIADHGKEAVKAKEAA
jgi:hypothetical protein